VITIVYKSVYIYYFSFKSIKYIIETLPLAGLFRGYSFNHRTIKLEVNVEVGHVLFEDVNSVSELLPQWFLHLAYDRLNSFCLRKRMQSNETCEEISSKNKNK